VSPQDRTLPPGAHRRGSIDWLRGLAILIMIEAHVLDAWTRPADRASFAFGCARILAGFAAPLFLFLAGLSVALAASARLNRNRRGPVGGGSLERPAAAGANRARWEAWLASLPVQRRGWQIFVLAFLFRFQSWLLNPAASPAQMLKVDILNIMGPAIAATAALWGVAATRRRRLAVLAVAMLATTLGSAWIRQTPLLAWLPDPIENYVRPLPGRDWFNFFPWAAFVFAGGVVGVLLDRRRNAGEDRAFHARLAAAGLAIAAGAYAASYLPSPIAGTQFWTTSPAFFFLRAGILVAAVGVVFFPQSWPPLTAVGRSRPMQRFGRSSLFVYWIHVEMVYGALTAPLHRQLSLREAVLAFALFSLLMYGLVEAKDRVKAAWQARRAGGAASFVSQRAPSP
jgi:uncharacterized membrane protein